MMTFLRKVVEEKRKSLLLSSTALPRTIILASTTTTLFFWSPAPILLLFFNKIIINYIYIVTCSSSKPCRRLFANKDFPQLPPTCLGAKLVGTSLVPRYLAVAVRVHGFSWSYSPFRCWSFEFPAVHMIFGKEACAGVVVDFLSAPVKECRWNSKLKSVYFVTETVNKEQTAWIWPTSGSIKIFKHFYGERRSWTWLRLQYSYEGRFTMSAYLCIHCS